MRNKREYLLSVLLAVALLQVFGTLQVARAQGVSSNRSLPLTKLVLHYYKVNKTCTNAEAFIKHLVTKAWNKDHSITPALLRLVYSDCLVTVRTSSSVLFGVSTGVPFVKLIGN